MRHTHTHTHTHTQREKERERERHKHKYIHYTNNKDSGKNITNLERIFAYIEIFVKLKSF